MKKVCVLGRGKSRFLPMEFRIWGRPMAAAQGTKAASYQVALALAEAGVDAVHLAPCGQQLLHDRFLDERADVQLFAQVSLCGR